MRRTRKEPAVSAGSHLATTRVVLSHRLGGGVTGTTHCTPPPFVARHASRRSPNQQWGVADARHQAHPAFRPPASQLKAKPTRTAVDTPDDLGAEAAGDS